MAWHPPGEGAEDRGCRDPGRGGQTAVLSPQVCEPPRRSRRPSRHWSLSIEERRRWAMLGVWQRRGAAGGSAHCLDVAQIVAQLVSQDVDKDVLIPHPRRSFESNHAFHAFLAQSVPSWQNSTLEAQVSSWPPS